MSDMAPLIFTLEVINPLPKFLSSEGILTKPKSILNPKQKRDIFNSNFSISTFNFFHFSFRLKCQNFLFEKRLCHNLCVPPSFYCDCFNSACFS